MATSHNTIPSVPIQEQSNRRKLIPCQDHYDLLQGFTELTGIPARQLLDEALEGFIQDVIRARVEMMIERAKRAERADKKAEKKAKLDSEIDEYLTKLEGDLSQ